MSGQPWSRASGEWRGEEGMTNRAGEGRKRAVSCWDLPGDRPRLGAAQGLVARTDTPSPGPASQCRAPGDPETRSDPPRLIPVLPRMAWSQQWPFTQEMITWTDCLI